MKQLTKFVAILSIGLIGLSCEKDAPEVAKIEDQTNSGPVLPNTTTSTVIGGFETKGKTLLLSGVFISGAHPTSGKAFIFEDTDKSKVLVFENLVSDPGPDLRIYLATDKAASSFVEVFNKVENGSKNFKIPTSVDLTKQKTVLIWCKAFSVNFGSAELK